MRQLQVRADRAQDVLGFLSRPHVNSGFLEQEGNQCEGPKQDQAWQVGFVLVESDPREELKNPGFWDVDM